MHRAQVSLYACNRLQAYACSRHNGASECSKKLSAGAAVLVGSKAGALNQERCLQSLLALQHAHDSGNCLQPASLCSSAGTAHSRYPSGRLQFIFRPIVLACLGLMAEHMSLIVRCMDLMPCQHMLCTAGCPGMSVN